MTLPIALTCGDPSGVGPELSVQAWRSLKTTCPFFWIGDPDHLPANSPYVTITTPHETAAATAHGMPVIVQKFPAPAIPGQPDSRNATSIIKAIESAVSLVQSGAASALCTNPINKKALQDWAGFGYPGHTEFLAALAKVERVVMMLVCDSLRVVPATVHIPLAEVPKALNAELLRQTLLITSNALKDKFAIARPRVAVAGLNPHGGEGGKMGQQEQTLIGPVLDRLRAEGLQIDGPLSADTMFHPAARCRYDVAICMYHDQALIPIKTLDFDCSVNLTLGLPFIRTSPDHGTAYDIAGCNLARPSSLINALAMAALLSKTKAEYEA